MRFTSPRRAALTAAGLLFLCALLVRDAARPPAPVAASAPATEFSAERALRHVREIAQRPHPVGSAENARIREYLLAELRALGLVPEVQEATGVGTRYAEAGRVKNVLARLPGRTPDGQAVVLMSHYDGVPGGPAAGDDAAGTAAILETLRALKAGPPLAHDVIALITDGEEAGLLGAAAFVREHPWANDIGVALNFEARGTRGRSYMFETGPGNLDVARVLSDVDDVSATSLSVTVYRMLPNDTDLSEIAVLGRPALNFAFADGVDLYHTTYDDVAHLDAGSLQHHGAQALALARAFGNGPLPRPTTGDAVFFELPLLGLVVYPEGWAVAFAVAGVLLVLAAVLREARRRGPWIRSIALGIVGTACAVGLAGVAASLVGGAIARAHVSMTWGGAPAFRGVYAAAIGMFALAMAVATYALARRWATASGAHLGALVTWGVLSLLVAMRLPGVSFLLTWPLLAAAVAAHVGMSTTAGPPQSRPAIASDVALWIATLVATAIIVPVVYSISAVLLGTLGPGGNAAAVLIALLAWLLAPQLEALGAARSWRVPLGVVAIALILTGVGMMTVRSSPDHPTTSSVTYLMDADSAGAWLVARGTAARVEGRTPVTGDAAPEWLRSLGVGGRPVFMPAPRIQTEPPSVTVVADSARADGRSLVLRVRAAPGTGTVSMRAVGARVQNASIDGRPIDASRYRSPVRQWRLSYAAPPDTGFVLGLSVDASGPLSLELTARSHGVPAIAGVQLAERPGNVVTAHSGDAMIVRRVVRLP